MGDVPILRLDAVREALPRADVAVSVSQFAASILLPGVAILRALTFWTVAPVNLLLDFQSPLHGPRLAHQQ